MNRLTKFALAAAAAFTVCSSAAFADAGIFGAGVILTGSNGPTLYEFTQTNFMSLGDSRYTPTAGSVNGDTLGTPSFDTSGGFSAGTENLGTYDITQGATLLFNGGELDTYKSGGANVNGAQIFYSLNGGSTFSSADQLAFNQDNVNGSTGDQRWYSDGEAVNLLNGLSDGTYTLQVYLDATTDANGTLYANNNSSPTNYTATFTVIPEPSTIMMLLSSGLFGSFYLISRRRK